MKLGFMPTFFLFTELDYFLIFLVNFVKTFSHNFLKKILMNTA